MSDFIIEAKVRSKLGKIQPIEDRIKGDVDDVIVVLTEKYSSKCLKKSFFKKLGVVFDKAYDSMENFIEETKLDDKKKNDE